MEIRLQLPDTSFFHPSRKVDMRRTFGFRWPPSSIVTFLRGALGIVVVAAAAVAPAALPAAEAGDGKPAPYSLSVGLDFTSGDYGGVETTDILQIPVKFAYETGPWRFAATIPYIVLTGPGDTTQAGGGPVQTGKVGVTQVTTRSGLGDVVLEATRSGGGGKVFLDYTAKVKLPTADESEGLGTGETDLSGQVDAFVPMGRAMPFVTLGYQILGDPPEQELDDGFFASFGGQYAITPRSKLGLVLDYREAASDGQSDPLELSPFVEFVATRRMKASFYAVLGLSDGSPDFGLGAQVTFR